MSTVINKQINENSEISVKTLLNYSPGSLGNNMKNALINSYFLIFLTDKFGINVYINININGSEEVPEGIKEYVA